MTPQELKAKTFAKPNARPSGGSMRTFVAARLGATTLLRDTSWNPEAATTQLIASEVHII